MGNPSIHTISNADDRSEGDVIINGDLESELGVPDLGPRPNMRRPRHPTHQRPTVIGKNDWAIDVCEALLVPFEITNRCIGRRAHAVIWKIQAGSRSKVRHRSEAEHIRHEQLLCIFDDKCVGGGLHTRIAVRPMNAKWRSHKCGGSDRAGTRGKGDDGRKGMGDGRRGGL